MRVFVALSLPKWIRKTIFDLGMEIKGVYPFVKVVPEENLHLTLRFLGEITKKEVDLLKENLLDLGFSFPLSLSEIGGFPTEMGARVVWVGVKDDGILDALRKRVDDIIDKLGFPKRDKPFVPHITMARSDKPIKIENFTVKLETFRANEVIIYESILSKPNSIYKPLKVIKLEGS